MRCCPAVSRIALVKPDKARGVEDLLLNAAKRGQLGQKVNAHLLRTAACAPRGASCRACMQWACLCELKFAHPPSCV